MNLGKKGLLSRQNVRIEEWSWRGWRRRRARSVVGGGGGGGGGWRNGGTRDFSKRERNTEKGEKREKRRRKDAELQMLDDADIWESDVREKKKGQDLPKDKK